MNEADEVIKGLEYYLGKKVLELFADPRLKELMDNAKRTLDEQAKKVLDESR